MEASGEMPKQTLPFRHVTSYCEELPPLVDAIAGFVSFFFSFLLSWLNNPLLIICLLLFETFASPPVPLALLDASRGLWPSSPLVSDGLPLSPFRKRRLGKGGEDKEEEEEEDKDEGKWRGQRFENESLASPRLACQEVCMTGGKQ